jgi:hypothetical protein
MNNTLANNHLSGAALGQGGDDRYRLVDGEMSHVNPVEASMIDAFGKKGEESVKERGSGTINPYTGNREYVDPFTLGMAAVSLYGMYASTKQQREGSGVQLDLIDQSLSQLDKSAGQLGESKEAREKAAEAEFKHDFRGLQDQTGQSEQQLKESYDQMIQKSGMATSGGAETKRSQVWSNIRTAFSRGKEGAYGKLGAKMGEIEGWFEGEKERIGAERRRLTSEKKLQSMQSEQKFLGIF